MNQYFALSDSIYDITQQYPVLIEFLVKHGFAQLQNEAMRKTMGKAISLEAALRTKRLDPVLMQAQMVEAIESQINAPATDSTACALAGCACQNEQAIRISGVLPCPIRLQLIEAMDSWVAGQKAPVQQDLQAASIGLDWLRDEIVQASSEDDLADIYLSTGFSVFYERGIIGPYMENGVFKDITGLTKLNRDFDNEKLDLKDPLRRYSMVGVVPAIFMVNTNLLEGRPYPRSWADLLTPEFENSVALPMRDLDLFNALILGIYKAYGENGVAKLGKSLLATMHPAEMVKNGKDTRKKQGPVVTVMPYFFTFTAGSSSHLQPVWPEDGAIISPIFLVTKASAQQKIQPLVDFLFSDKVGEIFSAEGKFPSTNPNVDNQLTPAQPFLWPGWDFIHSQDITALLADMKAVLLNAAGDIQ